LALSLDEPWSELARSRGGRDAFFAALPAPVSFAVAALRAD
jgi:hypothetical protein